MFKMFRTASQDEAETADLAFEHMMSLFQEYSDVINEVEDPYIREELRNEAIGITQHIKFTWTAKAYDDISYGRINPNAAIMATIVKNADYISNKLTRAIYRVSGMKGQNNG